MSPDIKILAVSNVYCRLMNFTKAGDIEEGHYHPYDHGTLLSVGKILLEMYNDDGVTIQSAKEFAAPSFMFVQKNKRHRLTALDDGTVACCIHALRDIDENIISPDCMVEQVVFADSPQQHNEQTPSVGEFLEKRNIKYKPLAHFAHR